MAERAKKAARNKRKWRLALNNRIRSAEGVRFWGSTLPLPGTTASDGPEETPEAEEGP